MRSILLTLFVCLTIGLMAQGKAEPNRTVVLKINGNKVELVNSKVKIAELKNAKLELECADKSVKINKYSITYSSKDLNKIASLEGEGMPQDLSSPKWEEEVAHKHLHAEGLILIKLTYTVAFLDGDAEKETTWMVELE
ncbi:MAG: hypothetical protein R2799_13020 [Crocinitomicaceae bacterium]